MMKCAWISRHKPLPGQMVDLKDYRIFQIDPPGRLWSAADALHLSISACGDLPDLFVVVMPLLMLKEFIKRVDSRAPVIRAVMQHWDSPMWTGRWEEVKSIEIVTQNWTPVRKEMI